MTDELRTTLRNASLQDLAGLLETQREAKRDVVVPASQITAVGGDLIVPGMHTTLTEDGVLSMPGKLMPTEVCDETIATKLDIPVKYLRSVRTRALTVPYACMTGDDGYPVGDAVPLIDAVLNAHFADHDKNVLVRAFAGDSLAGIARAVLSDRYMPIDNLDVLYSVLEAARGASTDVQVQKIDLSERTMRVFLVAPQITALAPTLLHNYRPPENGQQQFGTSDGRPVVLAGLVIGNSETGGGAFTVTPRFVVQICSNGMTQTKDALRHVHLGGQLEAGLVRWSEGTVKKNLELIEAKTRDAVSTFLDVEYMVAAIQRIEEKAGAPVERPEETLKIVATRLKYTESERQTILAHFIRGGQLTAGGVLNAVTSASQEIEDPDRAAEVEASAMDALAVAAG